MADGDPLSQMFNLFAAPLAGTIQSFDQFRRGVEEFLRGVENFNRTMENMNEASERINRLLGDVEEPLRAAIPQVTRTVKAADEMMKVVSGPAMAVAPGLAILAEALNNPALRQMPHQLTQMNEMLSEVTARLAPLGQLAETAGGLFGGFKLPGFGSGSKTPEPKRPVQSAPAKRVSVGKATAPTKKSAARKKTASKRA
jgi:ABC-type transporter Mla subunit MlaD